MDRIAVLQEQNDDVSSMVDRRAVLVGRYSISRGVRAAAAAGSGGGGGGFVVADNERGPSPDSDSATRQALAALPLSSATILDSLDQYFGAEEETMAGAAEADASFAVSSTATKRSADEHKHSDYSSQAGPAKKRSKRLSWDERCEQLKAFKKEHGHTRVPSKGDCETLYKWLHANKRRKNASYHGLPRLTIKQIDKLDILEIDWEISTGHSSSGQSKKRSITWDERYKQLKAFKQEYSHTRVPSQGDWKPLFNWLRRCKRRKNGSYLGRPQLASEQTDKLEELGIDWSLTTARSSRVTDSNRGRAQNTWHAKYEQLKAFKEKFGHTRVPRSGDWKPLQRWVYRIKRRKNGPMDHEGSQLTAEEIAKLDELDFDWTVGAKGVRQSQK